MAREDSTTGMTAHIDEDTLESYAMNRLAETETAPVEKHLLVCHDRQNRLAADRLLADLRSAAGPGRIYGATVPALGPTWHRQGV